jgi:hypothetical protein
LIILSLFLGLDHTEKWPFVSLSSFQRRTGVARILSGAVSVAICHHVEEYQRSSFKRFMGLDEIHYLTESYKYFQNAEIPYYRQNGILPSNWTIGNESFPIFAIEENGTIILENGPGPYLVSFIIILPTLILLSVPNSDLEQPLYQISPFPMSDLQGRNGYRQPSLGEAAALSMQTGLVVISPPVSSPPGDDTSEYHTTVHFSNLLSIANKNKTSYQGEPISTIFLPIFDNFEDNRTAVASIVAKVVWERYFEDLLPETDNGITVVLKSCKVPYTMEIRGSLAIFLGKGDLHDTRFDSDMKKANLMQVESIPDSSRDGLGLHKDFCPIELEIYPSMVCVFTCRMNVINTR